MRDKPNMPLLLGLMALFTAKRWPGLLPWNISPVYAICFCAGVYFNGWRAWLVPVGLIFVSDVLMNYFHYRPMGFSVFTPHMYGTYALYLGLAALGWSISERARPATLIAGGALGACGFFFVSNVLAWLINPVYTKTWAGLVQSFTTGEPGFPPPFMFLRNTALSGAWYTAVIVFAVRYARANEPTEAEFQLKI